MRQDLRTVSYLPVMQKYGHNETAYTIHTRAGILEAFATCFNRNIDALIPFSLWQNFTNKLSVET